MQGKAEDEGGLAPAEDGNDALRKKRPSKKYQYRLALFGKNGGLLVGQLRCMDFPIFRHSRDSKRGWSIHAGGDMASLLPLWQVTIL